MAELDLGKLSIKIELNNKEANEGLDETTEKVEKVEKKGSGKLKAFGKAAAAGFAVVGAAAVATGKKLLDMTNTAATTADNIDKAS